MKVLIQRKNGHEVVDLNRRKAIRERCLNCAGWFHKDVMNCTFTDCPLYPFRSGQGKQNAKARSKAIRKYCLYCMNRHHGEVSKCPSTDCPLFPYRKTNTDRSTEIKSLPKNSYIQAIIERKMVKEYLSMGSNGKN